MSASGDSAGVAVAAKDDTNLTNGEVEEHDSAVVAAPVSVPEKKQQQTSGKKFCLPIQAVIHEYRLKHGLRHQDFFRYRGYCSRRLKHIRKALKFTQSSHKKHFHKRPVNEDQIRLVGSTCSLKQVCIFWQYCQISYNVIVQAQLKIILHGKLLCMEYSIKAPDLQRVIARVENVTLNGKLRYIENILYRYLTLIVFVC